MQPMRILRPIQSVEGISFVDDGLRNRLKKGSVSALAKATYHLFQSVRGHLVPDSFRRVSSPY